MIEASIGAIAHYFSIEPKAVFLLLVIFALTALTMGLMVLYVLKRPIRVFNKNNISKNAKAILAKEGWKISTCDEERIMNEILSEDGDMKREDFYKKANKVRRKAGIPQGIRIVPNKEPLKPGK